MRELRNTTNIEGLVILLTILNSRTLALHFVKDDEPLAWITVSPKGAYGGVHKSAPDDFKFWVPVILRTLNAASGDPVRRIKRVASMMETIGVPGSKGLGLVSLASQIEEAVGA